jgi:protein-S-isoprenylcysteine O-methyltransferase Ste14
MTSIDPHLLVRAVSIYAAVIATWAAWSYTRPTPRQLAGAFLAFVWNVPALLLVNVAAMKIGWWTFDAEGGVFLDVPVDLYLAWAVLWGPTPALAFPRLPVAAIAVIVLAVDLIAMPLAAPVVGLGANWLVGEVAALLLALLPAQLLARWTARDIFLTQRVALLVVAFTGLLLFVLPAAIIEGAGGAVRSLWQVSTLEISLWIQLLILPGVIGISAVQEFAARGRGTPVPFDPPKRLVTSGLYAYIRNPMQLSAVLVLVILGAFLHNAWVAAAGVMAHIYSIGLAGWDEDGDLRGRFGAQWLRYRTAVRAWVPRLYPWFDDDRPSSTLYVSDTCPMCRDIAAWLRYRQPRRLSIVPAEEYPGVALDRITYAPGDGTRSTAGVEAFARALEHTHLGWALLGFALRIPGALWAVQLVVDACGGEPRTCPTRAAIR